ncbi:hypothetical protein CR513_22636, partial [Mucuna pruriens]
MYLYLLRSNDEALDAFKVFKAEVEKQYGKQIKIMRSDRDGEYYGRYNENEQAPGPFANFKNIGLFSKWCSRKKKSNFNGHDQGVDEEQQDYVEQQLIEQHVPPQDNETTLRRSIYLQESNYNIGAENDPKTFSQAMSSKESNLWYNVMKDEMDFMASDQPFDRNEFLKQRKTYKEILKDIRQDLLPKYLLKEKESTKQRHFLLYKRKILFE